MKELHNHIFSNTTCISKETMLKHINKQLSKSELHKVETHLLDCELCTDAYAGIAYAENSSMLFAIDNQIDSRVRIGVSKAPIMRNLMLAASVLVIVFGTYFTVTFFNETINNDGNLALNKVDKKNEAGQVETIKPINIGAKNLTETKQESELDNEIATGAVTMEKPVLAEKIAEGEMEEVIVEMDVALDDIEIFSAEVSEAEVAPKAIEEISSRNEIVDIEGFSANKFVADEESTLEKNEDVVELEVEKRKMNENNTRSKAKKTVVSARAYSGKVAESSKSLENKDQNTMVIADYKLVNYLDEYQESYDAKKRMTTETNSVSAGYANKLDKEATEKEEEDLTVEVTYKVTLERAIHLYKNKKYRKALSEFDVILWKHPEEVNAQFYSGLCYYHLEQNEAAIKKFDKVLKNKETEFNEETNWYKALTLIKMKNTTAAKKLLKAIVQGNGFYTAEAEERLKGL